MTGRESGRDGHGTGGGTYGQADVGQGNWHGAGPSGTPSKAVPASDAPLGQGSEPRPRGADGPADPDVRAKSPPAAPAPNDTAIAEPALGSGLSNYSRTSQYGNQGRYGTPSQYNEEPMVGGDVQNGDHPADRPNPGASGPAHPNG